MNSRFGVAAAPYWTCGQPEEGEGVSARAGVEEQAINHTTRRPRNTVRLF